MDQNKSTQPLKGFRDFLPEEMIKRNWLKDKISDVFEKWGYDPVETPTLEPLEIFEGQIGEDEKLFYKFTDQGDRRVALRYDQSVPIARFVAEHENEIPMPFRRYQIQPVFRAEKPQKGRFREFIQCDVDIFGVASPVADAEVIAVGLDVYRKLGFKEAKVLINDRQLFVDMPYEAVVAIDKLKKIGQGGVIAEMARKGISEKNARDYLKKIETIKPNETLKIIFEFLESAGFSKAWYEFDPTIARSFSYSSGPIWEIVIPGYKAGSVLGGERFDGLIESIAGKRIEATGFGLGFDRTLEAAEQFGLIPGLFTNVQVLVTIFNEDLIANSAKAAGILREEGFNVELYPDPAAKLAKQLKYANKKGIGKVVIIGPNEAEKDEILVRNMVSGEEKVDKLATSH